MEWPKITEETPLEEIKRIHQAIWDYAIEHGGKPHTPYWHDCVACEYANVVTRIFSKCPSCPISWPSKQWLCGSSYSIYDQWTKEEDPRQKANLARQIRDLSFKYELEEN